MTFWEYLHEAHRAKEAFPRWSIGRCYFNTLLRLRPELADDIRQEVDPVNDDSLCQEFLIMVKKNW